MKKIKIKRFGKPQKSICFVSTGNITKDFALLKKYKTEVNAKNKE